MRNATRQHQIWQHAETDCNLFRFVAINVQVLAIFGSNECKMEIFGKKETRDERVRIIVIDVSAWILLGLCVDHSFKVWARHGGAAMAQCEVYKRRRVKVCHVVARGSQRWASLGVERWFEVGASSFVLALKILEAAF